MSNLRDLGAGEGLAEDGLTADGLTVRWAHHLGIASLRYFDPRGEFAAAMGAMLGGPLPAPLRADRRALARAWGNADCGARLGKEVTADARGGADLTADVDRPEVVLAWRSPTETLLLSADAGCLAAVGAVAADRTDGCLVDQTGGILCLEIVGHRTSDLLLRLGSTDSIPAIGEARTSRIAELGVTSLCVRAEEILLLVERVFARHLMGWIRATVSDY